MSKINNIYLSHKTLEGDTLIFADIYCEDKQIGYYDMDNIYMKDDDYCDYLKRVKSYYLSDPYEFEKRDILFLIQENLMHSIARLFIRDLHRLDELEKKYHTQLSLGKYGIMVNFNHKTVYINSLDYFNIATAPYSLNTSKEFTRCV